MKKSKAIHAILGVIVVVMLCAIPTVVSAQGAIGVFCNTPDGKLLDRAWNLERDGTGDPGKKYFNYLYGLSDNKTGIYTLEFSSYWGFKFHSYYRERNTDKWAPYQMIETPRVLTDKNGRRFNHVAFDVKAPAFSPSQLLVQINAVPYDGNNMLSTVVWSRQCTQAPSVGMGCNWVEGSILGQPTTRWCECNGMKADPSKCPR